MALRHYVLAGLTAIAFSGCASIELRGVGIDVGKKSLATDINIPVPGAIAKAPYSRGEEAKSEPTEYPLK